MFPILGKIKRKVYANFLIEFERDVILLRTIN